MAKKSWKQPAPRDLRDAMDLSLEFAKFKHNRSVDRVAELMGEVNKWTLYKWIQDATLPLHKVKPFEMACGIDLVSRWLVMSNNKLVIDIPSGRDVTETDMLTLQKITHDAVGALMTFYGEGADETETLAAVQKAMEKLAWHRGNVKKYKQPEIFSEENDDE